MKKERRENMTKKAKSRYDEFRKQSVDDMAATLSFYFDCIRCPAKKDNCCENDASCIDAIKDWLEQEGQL